MISKQLIGLSILVSVIVHPLCYLIDSLSKDHERSTELLSVHPFSNHILRWDALFFYELKDSGYQYLKNHAFGIGLPFLFNIFGSLFFTLVFQKLINILSLILLYNITEISYDNNNNYNSNVKDTIKNKNYILLITSLSFIFSPASIYFQTLYTETFFTFMIFLGIYLDLKGHTILGASILSLSQFFRSNGLFYILFSGLPILVDFIISLKNMNLRVSIKQILKGIIVAILYILPYLYNLYTPYKIYCKSKDKQIPMWCNKLIPDAYSYIQQEYWDVGLFNSYKPSRALFIFFGLQGILLMGVWMWLWITNKSQMKRDVKQIGLFLQQILLFLVATCYAHVNCSTRFFSTSVMFYWALAELLKHRKFKWITLYYLIEFNIGGLILFTNFYLWA